MQFMYKNALYMRDLDLNGLTLRRLTLYPTEVRGLIHDLDQYAENMRDLGMNDLLLRRQLLYPTEVQRQIKMINKVYHKITVSSRAIRECSTE